MGNFIEDAWDSATSAARSAANAITEAANQAQAAAVAGWAQSSGLREETSGVFSRTLSEAEAAAVKAGQPVDVTAGMTREQLVNFGREEQFAPLRDFGGNITSPFGDFREFVKTPEGSALLPFAAVLTPEGRKNLAQDASILAPIAGNIVAPGIGGAVGQMAGGFTSQYFLDPGSGSEGSFTFELPQAEEPTGVSSGGFPMITGQSGSSGGMSMGTILLLAAAAVAAILVIKKAKG